MFWYSFRRFLGTYIIGVLFRLSDSITFNHHEYCRSCGFPLNTKRKFSIFSKKVHPLHLKRTNHEINAICKSCRKDVYWKETVRTYNEAWEAITLSNYFNCIPFNEQDVKKAIKEDRYKVVSQSEVNDWATRIFNAYFKSDGTEYFSFPDDESAKEIILASEYLINERNLDIKIIKKENKLTIILKSKLWEEKIAKRNLQQKDTQVPQRQI